ncbi:MAG: GFA family protein [Colwellia sp.]
MTTNIEKIVSCNCSVCTKKGVLHHRVEPEQFNLISGEESLALYRFETKKAKHYFCSQCGIHSFSNPRAAPDKYTINVRCLNDFDLESESYELVKFDGKNWEKKAAVLNEQLSSNKKSQGDA